MLQLRILSGRQAGAVFNARRFPVRIGRAAENDLRLEDDGVWDRHCEITLDTKDGFLIATGSGALLDVNSETVQKARLCNGDILAAGSAKFAVGLAETRQQSLALREAFVWTMVLCVTVAEIALVYWLIQ